VKLDVRHQPPCGGVRAAVSRWRCAVGWIVYLLVAVAVVVLVGAAHR
jgi:hypothetical protein